MRSTRDHVFDVVTVARRVDVCVVPGLTLILHMSDRDRDTTFAFLGGLVDSVERLKLSQAPSGKDLSDRRSKRGLPMVDMTNRAHVNVRLRAFELLSSHSLRAPSAPANLPCDWL